MPKGYVDVQLEIQCAVCGYSLKADITNNVIDVEVCEVCLKEEHDRGFDEGFEKGAEE